MMSISNNAPDALAKRSGTQKLFITDTLRYGLGLFLLLFVAVVFADVKVPELSRRVTDLTGTLTAAQINSIEQSLAAFEAKKGSQIAVLMLTTTQPETIEQFSIRVANAWKIGRKSIDDGVIFIIAKTDRKMRLEVGYGLEGAIPDAIAKRVIEETITPYFKNNDYAGGIDAGIKQLIKLIDGEALPTPTTGTDASSSFITISIFGLFVFSTFLSPIISTLLGSYRTIGVFVLSIGAGLAGVLWLSIPFGTAILIAVLIFFLLIFDRPSVGGSNYTDFGSGSRSDSGSSWGGGGGDFGGGGASGSW
jgi:uncharacterized protein